MKNFMLKVDKLSLFPSVLFNFDTFSIATHQFFYEVIAR